MTKLQAVTKTSSTPHTCTMYVKEQYCTYRTKVVTRMLIVVRFVASDTKAEE